MYNRKILLPKFTNRMTQKLLPKFTNRMTQKLMPQFTNDQQVMFDDTGVRERDKETSHH